MGFDTAEKGQARHLVRNYSFGKNLEYEITVTMNLADRKRAWAMVYLEINRKVACRNTGSHQL